jgi:hypothetical protein
MRTNTGEEAELVWSVVGPLALAACVGWLAKSLQQWRRWQTLILAELDRRRLTRGSAKLSLRIDPADGFQLVETQLGERDGRLYFLITMHRLRSFDDLGFEELPAGESASARR